MCKERVREFASRDAIHAPAPSAGPERRIRLVPPHERSDGHFSRWEAGPTSLGPVGRLTTTVLIVASLVWCSANNFIILCLPIGIAGGVVLRDVWKRTWIPSIAGQTTGDAPRSADTEAPESGPGNPRPEPRPAPVPIEIPARTKIAWVCFGVLGLAACVLFSYGNTEVKAAVLMASSLSALALWYANLA
jgi:hypothetical protein